MDGRLWMPTHLAITSCLIQLACLLDIGAGPRATIHSISRAAGSEQPSGSTPADTAAATHQATLSSTPL